MNNGANHIFELAGFARSLENHSSPFLGIDDGKDAAYYHARRKNFE